MEQTYRGYPQPYMIYNRENKTPQTGLWDIRWQMQTESDYFRGLYPLRVKKLQRVIEEEFDRIDRRPGPMYDEYPDREFLYRLRDRMYAMALPEDAAADRDLMYVLMLQELLRRRRNNLPYAGNDIQEK